MTNNQTEQTKESVATASLSFGDRVASWVDDPFKSALAATIGTFTAMGFVLGGIGLVSIAVS